MLHLLAQTAASQPSLDLSVFYYSYSTIAQALAGAFGFLAAIVLYRLQALNGQMERIAANLMGDPRTFLIEPYRTLFAYHRWNLFVENVNRDQDSSNFAPVFKNLNFLDLGAMNHANNQIHSIRRWFTISIIMTVSAISLCLIALSIMPWIQSFAFLFTLLAFGLLSLAAYTRLILIVLE